MHESITPEVILAAIKADGYVGICLACGAEADGIEPDARQYTCEPCGQPAVYGAEEILLMYFD